MEPVIRLSNICFHREERKILNDVNLTVHKGDFLAVTGPNGGGKTTLLRIMLKLLRPSLGTVEYFRPEEGIVRRLNIGYLPQKNMVDSHFPISVREVIASGILQSVKLSKSRVEALVRDTISRMELESHADVAIGKLSGGQLQRALFGRAIISSPEVLVLDEPLSYLDKHFEEHMYEILRCVRDNTTVILVSHEMSVISTMATRHIIVDHSLHECSASRHYIPTDCC